MKMRATIDLYLGKTVQEIIGLLAQLPPDAKPEWDEEEQLLVIEWDVKALANPQDLR